MGDPCVGCLNHNNWLCPAVKGNNNDYMNCLYSYCQAALDKIQDAVNAAESYEEIVDGVNSVLYRYNNKEEFDAD